MHSNPDVRFTPESGLPKADIGALFDHLVGASEQRRRHAEAQRSGRLQIDDELELDRLLHRQDVRGGVCHRHRSYFKDERCRFTISLAVRKAAPVNAKHPPSTRIGWTPSSPRGRSARG
jgi:hypothetical protein